MGTRPAVSDRTRVALRERLYPAFTPTTTSLRFDEPKLRPFQPGVDDRIPTKTEDGLVYDWDVNRAEMPLDLSGVKLLTQGANMILKLGRYPKLLEYFSSANGADRLTRVAPNAYIQGDNMYFHAKEANEIEDLLKTRIKVEGLPKLILRSSKTLKQSEQLDNALAAEHALEGSYGLDFPPAGGRVFSEKPMYSELGSAIHHLESRGLGPKSIQGALDELFGQSSRSAQQAERMSRLKMIENIVLEEMHMELSAAQWKNLDFEDYHKMITNKTRQLQDEFMEAPIEQLQQLYDRVVLKIGKH